MQYVSFELKTASFVLQELICLETFQRSFRRELYMRKSIASFNACSASRKILSKYLEPILVHRAITSDTIRGKSLHSGKLSNILDLFSTVY